MPNHKSAEKRVRQNERRNEVNRRNRSQLRTAIKKLRSAFTAEDAASGQELLPQTISIIDKMVHKGIIHHNTAARYKSRLTKHASRLATPQQ
jgi:small subunit ribosomal protein S20